MKYIYCLFIVCCLAAPQLSFSQGAPYLGIGWTGLLYTGDLTVDETDYLRLYPGSNIYLQFANQRAFRLRFSAGFGKIVEQLDNKVEPVDDLRQPNDYFETNLFYFDLRLMRYFFRQGPIQPYLGFGPSVFFFNPKDEAGNFLIDNIFTREEGEEFATTTIVWPATIGLSFPVGRSLRINADYTYRLNMSDYIDNISLLGNAPGRDRLHAFQVSFDVSLGINKKTKEPRIRESKPTAPDIVATAPTSQSGKRKLRTRKVAKDHHETGDLINELEVDHLLYYEMPRQSLLTPQEVYVASPQLEANQKLEVYQRNKLLEYIERKKLYKEVSSTGILSQEALAEVHLLPLETFQQLNPKLPEPVSHGYQILVPDWEAAAKAMDLDD